jgi:hypothetical protein
MAKDKEEKEESVDYEEVDQGVEEEPALQETATSKVKGKGKKGKIGKTSNSLRKFRDQIRCGFCGNSMNQSKDINVVEVKGKKIPKKDDGSLAWESPGAAKGKIAGVLCDTCKRVADTTGKRPDGSTVVDIKQVIALKEDGSIQMIRVGELQD